MTEFNIQAQIIELTDDQLELVEGGGWKAEAFKEMILKPIANAAFKRFFG